METHMTSEQARIRNAEILKSFRRMTEYAEQQKIRLVLIAGDLFDGERVTKRTVEGVLDAVRSTPQIDYLYVSGNHDDKTHAFVDQDVPQNFKSFTDQWSTFVYDDVAVSGIEITKANAARLYEQLPAQKSKVNIVMLHGQISTACEVDQVNLNLLKGKTSSILRWAISIHTSVSSWTGMESIATRVVWKDADSMSAERRGLSFWIRTHGS